MALITLRKNLYRVSDFQMHRALAALKNQPLNHVHKVVKERLCPWLCDTRTHYKSAAR
ncbi:FASTKD3 isoform 7 [Pan troglodytes]|uniref:FASTKD3 isoform 7 n=1 Tax=Pan troglodytes TaxID=9598 RepID=A0A2J8KU26_PANTR|nr:FASTKD3 isoform 7 [Pan troglodytes]